MKTVIYKGTSANIGRFGFVEQGAHLQLTEAEFAGVKNDADFDLISRRKPQGDISPLGTSLYDLRNIQWDRKDLTNILEKEGKSTLKTIAAAMALLGVDITVSEHDDTYVIVDAIVAEARLLGWCKLDRDTTKALPVFDESKVGGKDADKNADDGLDDLSVSELRELCKDKNLPTDGNKAALRSRLKEAAEDKKDND